MPAESDLTVRNCRLLGRDGLTDIAISRGRFTSLSPAGTTPLDQGHVIDAKGALVIPPYVEPHLHLDAARTAGQPRWNESGSLWEGISCWSDRKAALTAEDVEGRARAVLSTLAANGVLFARTHVDITDASLVALRALLRVKESLKPAVGVQLVAFPQEGLCSFDGGQELLREAVTLGVDAVGAIPHAEETREEGLRSLNIAFDAALDAGLMVDIHCDEVDDEQSRFLETLVFLARRHQMGGRVTASHTVAMGSYNADYSGKMLNLLRRSQINMVCNPLVNLALQGRLDGYPKRRGLTQVKELIGAGVNVALGHDDMQGPWFALGAGDPTQVALVGALASQMTAPAEVEECFRMITDRAARVLGIPGNAYGVKAGQPASFLIVDAESRFEIIRRQVRPSFVVSHGQVLYEDGRATVAATRAGLATP